MWRWFASLLLVLAGCAVPQSQPGSVAGQPPPAGAALTLDQGWTDLDRGAFYSTGQGSQLIRAAWFNALRRPDADAPFAADGLARYGYLPSGSGLPIGFVVDPLHGDLGLTCAACHTGAVRYNGQTWRIDGGRANADFQRFLTDLAQSARNALAPDRFDAFAAAVIGPQTTPDAKASLRSEFAAWTDSFSGYTANSLPAQPWGAGRLDAFGMIFNRLTAYDLAIPANYHRADAPVRYPFVWNAVAQDRTQWDGAAPNGNYVKGLARNTGEVFGVFGALTPKRAGNLVYYENSVDFRNLQTLEEKVAALKPPPWPRAVFGLNAALIPQGALLFASNCASCHGQRASTTVRNAWATPVCRVGTDPMMYGNALLSADSGSLAGTLPVGPGGFLKATDAKVSILANAVVGSLVDDIGFGTGLTNAINRDIADQRVAKAAGSPGKDWVAPPECAAAATPPPSAAPANPASATGAQATVTRETAGLYVMPAVSDAAPGAAYEARVLGGIWAAAPYLHNGSVPTLWQLLTPARSRPRSFAVGLTEFDPVDVGVAGTPAAPGDFDASLPGNSNAGHEYGTTLPEPDRRALLEYLKTL